MSPSPLTNLSTLKTPATRQQWGTLEVKWWPMSWSPRLWLNGDWNSTSVQRYQSPPESFRPCPVASPGFGLSRCHR